jgi:hypothetical protein
VDGGGVANGGRLAAGAAKVMDIVDTIEDVGAHRSADTTS